MFIVWRCALCISARVCLFLAVTVASQAAQSEPSVPEPRGEQAAVPDLHARVANTFGQHCASCHARNRQDGTAAIGRVGALTRPQDIAHSPWVVPGNPDVSPLYHVLHQHHAPHDIFAPFANTVGPTPDEIADIREWITNLPQRVSRTCADGDAIVRPTDVVRAALAHLGTLTEAAQKRTRFLSLAHRANACDDAGRLRAYAKAVALLFSRLTWNPEVPDTIAIPIRRSIEASPVPQPSVLWAVDLSALGWTAKQWDDVARMGRGLRVRSTARLSRRLARMTDTPFSLRTADSFAKAVVDLPLDQLPLLRPDDPKLFAKLLGVSNINAEGSAISALPRSGVTGYARLIQRFAGTRSALWLARDLPSETVVVDDRKRVAPRDAPSLRALFNLPNGALGFAQFKLTDTPPLVDVPPTPMPSASPATLRGCLRCHGAGPRTAARIASDDKARVKSYEADTAHSAKAETQPVIGDNLRKIIAADHRQPLDLDGVDPVVALANLYTAPVHLAQAAGEYGVRPETLTGILSEWIADGSQAARRLSLGPISRDAFNGLIDRSLRRGPDRGPTDQLNEAAPPALTIWPERERLRVGEPIVVKATANRPCYLTVIAVDVTGQSVMLIPNGFDGPIQLRPGETTSIPPQDAPYTLRANLVGRERLLGFCSASPEPVHARELDFERQVFPSLGPWPSALKEASERFEAAPNAEQFAALKARHARRVERIKRRNRRRSRRRQILLPKPVVDKRPRVLMRSGAAYEVIP